MYLNQIIITGYLGADAKFAAIGQNRFVANFRVAATKERPGAPSRTTWFNVKLYLSENGKQMFEERLYKGTEVFLKGEFLEDCKQTDSGNQYYRFIVAEQVEVIGVPKRPVTPDSAFDEMDEFPVVDGPGDSGFIPPEPLPRSRPVEPALTPRSQTPPKPPVQSHDRHPQERRRDAIPADPAPKRVTPLPDDAPQRFDVTNW